VHGPHRTIRGSSPVDWPRVGSAIAAGVAILAAGAATGAGYGPLLLAGLVVVAVGAATVAYPAGAALIFIAILPLGFYLPLAVGASLFVGLPVALLIAFGILMRLRDVPARRFEAPAALFVALVAITTVAGVLSADPKRSMTRVIYLLSFGAFAWAIGRAVDAGLLTSRRVIGALLTGATIGGLCLVGQFVAQFPLGTPGILEWLDANFVLFGGLKVSGGASTNWLVPDLKIVRAIFPFMGAPSAGQYMMLGLVSCAFVLRARALPRRLAWPVFVIVLAGLLATISRQAWVGAAVGIVVLLLRDRALVMLAVGAVAGAAIMSVPIPGTHTTLIQHLSGSADLTSRSSAERIVIWSDSIDLVRENPIHGIGPGLYSELNGPTGGLIYAHNVVLDFLVETGVIGGLLFVLLAIDLLRRSARSSNALAFPVLVAWITANMFDDAFYFPRNGFYLATVIGLALVAKTARDRPSAEPPPVAASRRPASRERVAA
jgi:hypothetical protein